MMTAHSGYHWTSWRCSRAAALAAVVVLSGAATQIAASEETAERSCGPAASPGPSADVQQPSTSRVSYAVQDVLAKIREERAITDSAAAEFLELRARGSVILPTPASDRDQVPQRITCFGGRMSVVATSAGHKRVEEMLDAIRKFGTATIVIEVRFLSLGMEEMNRALPESTSAPMEAPETPWPPQAVVPAVFDRPLASREGTRVARTQFIVEKSTPMRFRVMDEAQGEELLRRSQENPRTNVLQAPRVTVFSGQTAHVSDTSQSPFVVGLKEVQPGVHQPQIRVVSEGTTLQLRPVADPNDSIHLDFAAAFSQIRKVETLRVGPNPADGKDLKTVQIPETATLRMEGSVAMKSGQWLLLGGPKLDDQSAQDEPAPVSWQDRLLRGGKRFKQRERQELALMLRADKVQLP